MLLENVILRSTRALQPAATVVGPGTLFCVTDESHILERSSGVAWEAYSPLGATGATGPAGPTGPTGPTGPPGSSSLGSVTHTAGPLDASHMVLGNVADDVKILADLGNTQVVLHGNASGVPTWGKVDMANDVTGSLAPFNGGTGGGVIGSHAVVLAQGFGTMTSVTGTAVQVLHGGGSGDPVFSAVIEADLSLSNNATADVSIARHGFVPIAPNDATQFLDGTGVFSVPVTGAAAAGTLTGATLAAGVLASSLTSVGVLATLTVTAPIVGSVTGASGSTSGNAATATAFQTPRLINGVSFDGSANITVAAAAGTLTGATLAANVLASSLTSVGVLATLTVTAAIVGSVTGASGSTTGNAATATALQTARLLNGVSFDGSANVTLPAAAGTLSGATLAAGVLASSLTSVGVLATLTVTAAIVGSVTGNAATATALQAARLINGVSFDGTANVTVTAAAGTLTGATLAAGVLASSLTSVGVLATLTVTATITGSVSGNAATATAFQTPRLINSVSFDGSADITVTAAAGTLTGGTLAAGVLASSLTSLGIITSLAATLITVTKTAIAATTVVGLSITNTTPATSSVQQNSPVLQLVGQGWGTTGGASVPVDVIHRLEPVSGATATYNYSVYGEINSGGYALLYRVTSFGNFVINSSTSYGWSSRSSIASPTDGQINLANLATTVGVGLDLGTDSILKVRNRAQNADGAVKAAYYSSSASSVLTITSNAIAPTTTVHHVGAGLIKTITVPTLMASPSFLLIVPDAAFTYDATGNIVVPSGGGTATINRVMLFVWDGTKWTPNY